MQNQSLLTLKQQLATAIRMLEKEQHIDFNGHFSVRVPETEYIFINAAAASRKTVTEYDIITIDLNGEIIEGNGTPPNEYPLHTEIYKRRNDIQAIVHTHPRWSTLFTIANVPLRPVIIQGAVLGEIPVFPKSQSISSTDIANELTDQLSEHQVILLKAHGAVVTGDNIMETFVRSIFLEENACRQYMASQMGDAHSLDEEEVRSTKEFIWQKKNIQKVWDYYVSNLSTI
ncbi:hypothetical protein BTO30_14525 [Domibacillus antri]|uniref:Class II aldolase/adducin N-terminal domain-containing protein n=1 Tax=Domibacillus antri TaxID=1714264 RepID=A0A1Q8Q2G3_9BACI|nr:class II aldolase/adducin family protein [Domibacillus antri]OLN21539.1 hypothetical protein BTO30_14525 [Domibacillus antri]